MEVIPVGYKTILCNRYEKGYCMYGDACTFAHGKEDVLIKKVVIQNQKLKNEIKDLKNMLKRMYRDMDEQIIYVQKLEYELYCLNEKTSTQKLIDKAFNKIIEKIKQD